MGYYTRYAYTVYSGDMTQNKTEEFNDIVDLVCEDDKLIEPNLDPKKYNKEYIAKVKDAYDKLEPCHTVLSYLFYDDTHKWYDHENDMKKLSSSFPQYVFQLNGTGEESGDIWVKWFHKGKMQGGKAKMVLPEFDPKAFK